MPKLYEAIWAETHRVVNNVDPEGLLEMGAPDDEYDDVVGMLTRHLIDGTRLLPYELESWFSVHYGSKSRTEAASEIVKRLDEVRGRLL